MAFCIDGYCQTAVLCSCFNSWFRAAYKIVFCAIECFMEIKVWPIKHSVRLCSIKHSNSLWSTHASHSIQHYCICLCEEQRIGIHKEKRRNYYRNHTIHFSLHWALWYNSQVGGEWSWVCQLWWICHEVWVSFGALSSLEWNQQFVL